MGEKTRLTPATAPATIPATPPPTPHPGGAPITDRRTWPLGVLPRQLQLWFIIGTVAVMAAIMSLPGPPPPSRSASPSSPASTVVDPNLQRIEEYQRRIQEQTQRLAAEQAELQLAKEALGGPSGAPSTSPNNLPNSGAMISSGGGVADSAGTGTGDALRQERAQRAYRSLFVDSVAFTRDPRRTAASPDAAPSANANSSAPSAPLDFPMPQLYPPSFPPSATSTPPIPSPAPSFPPPSSAPPVAATSAATAAIASAPSTSSRVMSPIPITNPAISTYRISEGSIIETVLTNRLDGTFAGPVNCLVTTPVYAPDRQRLLIPVGTRALGEARPVNALGQSRLAVVFHRLLFANGARVNLESFHGLNQIGETGLHDYVDQHYKQIFGASLALGAIAGFAQAPTAVGLGATVFDIYRQSAATSVAQSSTHILDRFLNLLPTVTIREGHRIKIYLSNDLELPEYRDTPADPIPGGRP